MTTIVSCLFRLVAATFGVDCSVAETYRKFSIFRAIAA